MPSKKKKFNARFPPARIKKIMQTDEDVGKVAAAVPVIISRALELFIESFMQKTATVTKDRNAKTLSASHVKQTIHSEKTFDFLRDLVANVPDHQPEEDGDSNPPFPSCSAVQEVKKPRVQRAGKEKTGAKRGRPRKKDVVKREEEMEEDKEETESEEEEGEDGSDSDSSPTNTEQPETSSPANTAAQPTIMQSNVLSNSTGTDSSTNSMCQMNSPYNSHCLPSQNPLSPRLPLLQSPPPQFPNVPMMPHPHFQNIPHPQLQNMPMPQLQNIPVPLSQTIPMHNMPHPQLQTVANHMGPPHPGLMNQVPPPPPLRTGLSNPYPMPPSFYGPHAPQMPLYPIHGSNETFHNDQKLFMNSRGTTPFNRHSNMETINPGNRLYMNNIQNNEPLDMSKSSQNKRSPSPSQEPVTKGTKQASLMEGLPNIMNMTASKQTNNDDDDYDT